MPQPINADEKRWQRQDDARVLAQAEEIKSNPSRMKGAKSEASKMAKEQEAKAKAMKKVASGSKTQKKSIPKAKKK